MLNRSNINYLDHYNGKVAIRKYLEEINKDKKVALSRGHFTLTYAPLALHLLTGLYQVIEYCLFQPGWFLNLLAGNRKTTKHIEPSPPVFIDFDKATVTVAGSLHHRSTYTSVKDIVNIVVRAVEYEGEWPRIGGINGTTLSLKDFVNLGEKVLGKSPSPLSTDCRIYSISL